MSKSLTPPSKIQAETPEFVPQQGDVFSGISATKNINSVTVLQTAQIHVRSNGQNFKATVLFDTGSDNSYISKKISSVINPKLVGFKNLSYSAFGEKSQTKPKNSKLFSVDLVGLDKAIYSLEAIEIPYICKPLFRPQVPISMIERFGPIQFADSYAENRDLSIDLLIGMRDYWKLVQLDEVIKHDNLIALKTIFGWILSGACETDSNNSCVASLLCANLNPEPDLQRFWSQPHI